MNPQLVTLILQILIQYGPEAFNAVVSILKKTEPTAEDCDLLVAKVNKPLHE